MLFYKFRGSQIKHCLYTSLFERFQEVLNNSWISDLQSSRAGGGERLPRKYTESSDKTKGL